MDVIKEYNIPDELKGIIPGYIGRRYQDIVLLRTFIANNDFDSISKLGHKLKGNGASFGFDRISELGGLLMEACNRYDITELKSLVADFEIEITSIKTIVL